MNPLYKEKVVGKGVVLDVNSLYPYVMYEKPMPFGEPVFFEGQYKEDKVYPLYIQMITCTHFKIKKNKIPTIQIKKSIYRDNEYLEEAGNVNTGEYIGLCLTNIDLQLFKEHYDIDDLEYLSGWKFKSTDIMFKQYIDKWIERKNQATIEKNKGQRTMAKLMLNSLYGKLSTSLEVVRKISVCRR